MSNKNHIARLGYDLDWKVPDSLIFTEIARLWNSLLILPASICYAEKIKLISTQQNDTMQRPKSGVTLALYRQVQHICYVSNSRIVR